MKSKSDIVQVKFKIEIPKNKWLSRFTYSFPNLNFKILSKLLLDENTGLTLLQITGSNIRKFLSELKTVSDLVDYQILFQNENDILLSVKTKDPWILGALIKTQLLLIYPLIVKEGFLQINAIAERKKIDSFLSELENKNIDFQISSIGYYSDNALLTKRQEEILDLILRKGYFDIPRRISLTKLAKELNISASALSETIRRISKTILNFYKKQNRVS
ncbi:MAG: helix-turn-helix domain-containing protein [Promethearchaeota archaeon]